MNKKPKAVSQTWWHQLATLIVIVAGVWLATRTYIHPGVPYTHDGENHLARFANYKLALKDGQLPPRWAPALMNHYGYPVFNYNYPLPNILAMPLVAMGVSYESAFKLIVVGCVGSLLAGSWWWLGRYNHTWLAKLVAVGTIATSPYLLSAVWFRGSIGEVMSLASLPWLLGIIERVSRDQKWQPQTWWAMVFWLAWWLLAHNVAVLITAPVLAVWCLWRWRGKHIWWPAVEAGVLSFGLSAWFWIPALLEKKLVVLGEAGLSNQVAQHAVTFSQLLWSPLQFGFSLPGPIDSLGFQLGVVSWVSLGIILCTWFITKLRSKPVGLENSVGLWVGIGWVVILAQLSLAARLWTTVPFLNFVQFPWRLSLIWLVIAPLWIANVVSRTRWIASLLGILLMGQVGVALHLKAVDRRHYPDEYYENFGQSTTTANENRPVTFEYLNIGDWQPAPTVVSGQAEVLVSRWTGTTHEFQITAAEPVVIVEPTMMYAGWQTAITDQAGAKALLSPIFNAETQGRIAYQVPAGHFQVRTRFGQVTPVRHLANVVSLVALIVLGGKLVWTGHRWGSHRWAVKG